MYIEPPSSIAIIGAGPIGLECALYARYLGYRVNLYERGQIGDHLSRWGHIRLFSPFEMNRSSLGLAAIAAQSPDWQQPKDDALLTGREFLETYLRPLAETDLLGDSIQEHVRVLAIGRQNLLKGDRVGDARRGDGLFRLLLAEGDGRQRIDEAEVVIDASGTYFNPNVLGRGGIPAIGESMCGGRIEYGLSDVLGADHDRYANRNTLVIGSGYSAATTVVALAELANNAPETRVTWITRSEQSTTDTSPIQRISDDRLSHRDQLAAEANQLASASDSVVSHWPNTTIEAVTPIENDGAVSVTYSGEHEGQASFDRIIANVGYRPDNTISRELQNHTCYASDAPIRLAAKLAGETSVDCLDRSDHGADSLRTPEPNFFVIGAKSYGRNSNFLISIGLTQIQQLFTILGDRDDLDLYSTMKGLA